MRAVSELWAIFSNRYIWCGLTSYFVAQALKIPTYYLVEKRWDVRRFVGSGGMPSSHSAIVVSLAILIGAFEGFDTPLFALSVALMAIVMYDAAGVRRETGKQGAVINEILEKVLIDGKPISDDEFKELVGHTPFEVAGGAIVGILVAVLFIVTA